MASSAQKHFFSKPLLLIVFHTRLSSGSVDGVLEEGREYSVGGKEIELDRPIAKADYSSGRCFGNGLASSISVTPTLTVPVSTSRMKATFVPPTLHKLSEKRGIPLQAVNLSSRINTSGAITPGQSSETAVSPTYWTVNWLGLQSLQ